MHLLGTPLGWRLRTCLNRKGTVINLILNLLDFYTLIILIRVILSWVNPNPHNPAVQILYKVTDPVLNPIRRMLPSFGGLDISPLVVFFAIWFLKSLLLG